ncbi:unnamed protein product [Phyllotreta striolata]|uniref:PPIase cyclophilin-type domain-containing protein n=1 Tax=Phyllotreta striolata TaxID=444603 RepID=A0A9N9TCN0_PHYSR|nr:unnamed protein product [Phyllotreta striolata]
MTDEAVQVKDKFFVAGLIPSPEFQKCRYIVKKLYMSHPGQYERPEIRSMLNVEWEEFLTKLKRTYGNGVWGIRRNVIVFNRGEFVGDDKVLLDNIVKLYQFSFNTNWSDMGNCHLVDVFQNIMDKFRQLVYMMISINGRVIGTLLFELYSDIVPLACENFLNKCKNPEEGFSGTPVHRIVKNSWVQCGGWGIPERQMRCENYVVPHNRRGVLCTTNTGRHKNNTSQFFITLGPTPWMDQKYVAFGQLIQGAEILRQIEEVPTYYEAPKYSIIIEMTGEVTLDRIPDYLSSNQRQEFEALLPTIFYDGLLDAKSYDQISPTASKFDWMKYKKGMYGLKSDLKSYLPFMHLLDYMIPLGGEGDDKNVIDSKIAEDIRLTITQKLNSFTLPKISDITL